MSELAYTKQKLFIPETLLSRLMDDEALMKMVLEACLPDLGLNLERYKNQLEKGEIEEATRTIHSMKGSAQNSDMKALAHLAMHLEDLLKAGEIGAAKSLEGELERIVGESIQSVEGYFSERS